MARGEIPGDIIGIDCVLTYSATTAYGHASAGKDLVMSMTAAGNAVIRSKHTWELQAFLLN